jgi:hypothetical protein
MLISNFLKYKTYSKYLTFDPVRIMLSLKTSFKFVITILSTKWVFKTLSSYQQFYKLFNSLDYLKFHTIPVKRNLLQQLIQKTKPMILKWQYNWLYLLCKCHILNSFGSETEENIPFCLNRILFPLIFRNPRMKDKQYLSFLHATH